MNRQKRMHIKPFSREQLPIEVEPLHREDVSPGLLLNLIANFNFRNARRYFSGEPGARLLCVDDPEPLTTTPEEWYMKRIRADIRRDDEAQRRKAITEGKWTPLDFSPKEQPVATVHVMEDYRANRATLTSSPDSTGPFKWATENDNGDPHWIVAKLKDQTGS